MPGAKAEDKHQEASLSHSGLRNAPLELPVLPYPLVQITTVEEKHQEAAEAAAEQKAGGRKRGRGAAGAAAASKKAKPDLEALTQVGGVRGCQGCGAAPGCAAMRVLPVPRHCYQP